LTAPPQDRSTCGRAFNRRHWDRPCVCRAASIAARRRIKTQTVLLSTVTAATLLASGQNNMRKVDG
jgi:hypothetical protein